MRDIKVSIVMPTRNAEKFLRESVDSILAQTMQNFELLVVDDGSTDRTLEILNSYEDGRIKILQGPCRGIAAALNMGIRAAEGEFIARMDADDICMPQRFEKQVATLEAAPDAALCSSDVELMGVDWPFWGSGVTEHCEFYTRLLWEMPLCHPAVMFRKREFIEKGIFYDESFTNTEDFEFFSRAVTKVRFCGVNEKLLRYRMHEDQATTAVEDKGKSNYLKVIKRNFKERLDVDMTDMDAEIFWNGAHIKGWPGFKLHRFFQNSSLDKDLEQGLIQECIKKRIRQYYRHNAHMHIFKPVFDLMYKLIEPKH